MPFKEQYQVKISNMFELQSLLFWNVVRHLLVWKIWLIMWTLVDAWEDTGESIKITAKRV
jgi:hypothetical protein